MSSGDDINIDLNTPSGQRVTGKPLLRLSYLDDDTKDWLDDVVRVSESSLEQVTKFIVDRAIKIMIEEDPTLKDRLDVEIDTGDHSGIGRIRISPKGMYQKVIKEGVQTITPIQESYAFTDKMPNITRRLDWELVSILDIIADGYVEGDRSKIPDVDVEIRRRPEAPEVIAEWVRPIKKIKGPEEIPAGIKERFVTPAGVMSFDKLQYVSLDDVKTILAEKMHMNVQGAHTREELMGLMEKFGLPIEARNVAPGYYIDEKGNTIPKEEVKMHRQEVKSDADRIARGTYLAYQGPMTTKAWGEAGKWDQYNSDMLKAMTAPDEEKAIKGGRKAGYVPGYGTVDPEMLKGPRGENIRKFLKGNKSWEAKYIYRSLFPGKSQDQIEIEREERNRIAREKYKGLEYEGQIGLENLMAFKVPHPDWYKMTEEYRNRKRAYKELPGYMIRSRYVHYGVEWFGANYTDPETGERYHIPGISERARQASNYTCADCGRHTRNLHVHHVIPLQRFYALGKKHGFIPFLNKGEEIDSFGIQTNRLYHDPRNLVVVCEECHKKYHEHMQTD